MQKRQMMDKELEDAEELLALGITKITTSIILGIKDAGLKKLGHKALDMVSLALEVENAPPEAGPCIDQALKNLQKAGEVANDGYILEQVRLLRKEERN